MAVRLNAFVPQEKALETVTAVCEIFREQQDLRENRTRGALKYLFMRHGWTAERMLQAVEERWGSGSIRVRKGRLRMTCIATMGRAGGRGRRG